MKEVRRFLIGSKVFFKKCGNYLSHDEDYISMMDDWVIPNTITLNMRKDGKDIFFIKNTNKEELLLETLKYSNVPMKAGKFLVPEFANYIGLTIDDLKTLEPMFRNMDEKHKYEEVIYDAYISNNAFILTNEQRQKAFETYINIRKNSIT